MSPLDHLHVSEMFISDDEAEAILAAFDEQNPHLLDDALADEPLDLELTPDGLAAMHVNDSIAAHDAWHARLAAGDPYCAEVAAACERWQQEQDTLRDLRRWKKELDAALTRRDSRTAAYIQANIQAAKSALRAVRKSAAV